MCASEARRPAARRAPERTLLALLSCLDTHAVPWWVFVDHAASLPEELAEAARTEQQLRELVQPLVQEQRLAQTDVGLELPARARAALRTDLGSQAIESATTAAVELLEAAFPREAGDVRTWARGEPLVDHGRAAVTELDAVGGTSPAAVRLLLRIADHLASRGVYADAVETAEQASALAERIADLDDRLDTMLNRTWGQLAIIALDRPLLSRMCFERAIEVDEEADEQSLIDLALDHMGLATTFDRTDDTHRALTAARTAVELLDRAGAQTIEMARARRMLASSLVRTGDHEAAAGEFDRARELALACCGAEHPEVAEIDQGRGIGLAESDDLDGARQHLQAAVDGFRRTLGPDHPETAIAIANLADVALDLRRYGEARGLLAHATAIAERAFPPHHDALWFCHDRLARATGMLGEFSLARTHREKALASTRHVLGVMAPRHARELLDLGAILRASGELAAAREVFEQAIATFSALATDDGQLAACYRALGGAQLRDDLLVEAAASYRRARALDVKTDGWRHVTDDIHIAWVAARLVDRQADALDGRPAASLRAEAASAFDRATAAALEETRPERLVEVAAALVTADRPTLAREVLERAEAALAAGEPEFPLGLPGVWRQIGGRHRETGEHELALHALRRSLELLETAPDRRLLLESRVLREIASVQRARGDLRAADKVYRERLDRSRTCGDARDLQTGLSTYGRFLREHGRLDEAAAAFAERLRVLVELDPPEPYLEGVALHDIASVLDEQGALSEAAERYRAALDRKQTGAEGDPSRDPDIAVTAITLARVLQKLDELDEAVAVLTATVQSIGLRADPDLGALGAATLHLGTLRYDEGDLEQAVPMLRRAVASHQSARDVAKLETALLILGRALEEQEADDEALVVYGQRLALLESRASRDPLDEGSTLRDLGDVFMQAGDVTSAREHYLRAVARLRSGGAERQRPRSLASALLMLARALLDGGDQSGALAALEERLELLRRLPKPDLHGEGVTLHDIADVHRARGDMAEAARHYAQAVERKRRAGTPHTRPDDFVVSLNAWSAALAELGDAAAAAAAAAEAEAISPTASA